MSINSVYSSPVSSSVNPLAWPILPWTRVLILNPSHVMCPSAVYSNSRVYSNTTHPSELFLDSPWQAWAVLVKSVFPTSTLATTVLQGLVPLPPFRLVWPSNHCWTTSSSMELLPNSVCVVTWSDPRNSKGNCKLFSLWWGDRISLSCTVTVMFIDLFPHNNIRSTVSTVVKQVTSGLAGFNHGLQTVPVQISHIIITSFISVIWTLIMLVLMVYDCWKAWLGESIVFSSVSDPENQQGLTPWVLFLF